ncbi:MAG: AAA family ATPase [Actinomycetia bacterium]|nr:AAA family ATPase [Actinomycetes bacterium]
MSAQGDHELSDEAIKRERAAFRMAISRLRAHLPEGVIVEVPDEGDRLNLDAAQVDAWRLLELSSNRSPLGALEPAELLHLLNPVTPFGTVADLEFVQPMIRRIRDAQRALFYRLSSEHPELLRGEFLEHLRLHLEEDPYNETLLALLVVAEAETGNRRRALDVLRTAGDRFNDAGLDLSDGFDELELDLLDGKVSPRLVPHVSARQLQLPGALDSARVGPHVGRDDQLEELATLFAPGPGLRSAIISGRLGVGKTRLCAELASMAVDRGVPCIYLSPSRAGSDTAFGPLITALASFRKRASQVFDRNHDPDIQRAQLWTAALDAMEAKAGPGRLLLIVDESQQLDVQTAHLISHLPASELASRLALVVVEGSERDPRSSESVATIIGAQPSTLSIELDMLDESAMRSLVSGRHPEFDGRLVQNLARQLHRLSHGLAGAATLVLANLDDLHMIPDVEALRGDRLIESIVANLATDVFEIGLMASVIGLGFDLDALEAISGRQSNDLLLVIDELIERELLREGETQLEFEVVHVLVQSAFLSRADTDQLLHFNQLAAQHFADDIHRRAHHQANAYPLVDQETAVASLLGSAAVFLDRGAYQATVKDYRQVQVVSGRRLPPDHEGLYARALELSGLPTAGRRVRDNAFSDALEASDHELALSVATSGLPEGESVDGDRDLVANLLKLDASNLSHNWAHAHACHLARQLTIVGRLEDAAAVASRATRLATDPDQEIRAAIASRFAISATSTPAQRLTKLEAVEAELDQVPSSLQADYFALRVIDHYECPDFTESHRWRRRIDEIDVPLPPLRVWHALMFDAMAATDAGEVNQAQKLRDAAHDFAINAGIGEAVNARMAPELIDLWLADDLGSSVDLVGEGAPLDPEGSVLAQAGAALALEAAGRSKEAIAVAESLANSVVCSPASQGTAALALVASVLAHSEDRRLVATVRSMLATRGQSFLVVAACVASLGPTDRYMAELTESPDEARRHRLQAVETAKASGSLLWEAVTRRDLVEHYDDKTARAELLDLTRDSELTHLAPPDG